MEVKPVVLTGKHVRLEPMTEDHVPGLAGIEAGPDSFLSQAPDLNDLEPFDSRSF